MRGKQVLMETLAAQGVEYIFGNPGTTESPVIDSLASYSSLRYIVALHEGVALGAAAYYAHASGRTGFVNLHVAPGLGNALGMLYGAARAGAPLVVTAGQQDTRMRLREPLLGHDLVAMAAPLTKWSVQVERADELALCLRRAFKLASDPPSGPVFVALPIDVLEQETAHAATPPGALYRASLPDPAGVEEAAALLLGSRNPAIVLGDVVGTAGVQAELLALAEALGAAVWYEGVHLGITFPTSHPNCRLRLGLDTASIRRGLDGADVILLVGGHCLEEVWFAPGSPFPDGATLIQVADAPQRLAHDYPVHVGLAAHPARALGALRAAVERGAGAAARDAAARRNAALRALKAQDGEAQRARAARGWEREPMSMPRVMAELAAALPTDAIVVEEAITAALDLARTLPFTRPGDYWGARGGGIGQALAGGLGVKLAEPSRPVIVVSGDGSAMYTIQALWTAAHHELAVVVVILDNGEYRILKHNMDTYRQRFAAGSDGPSPHMDLASPRLDFVELARGMGVAAARVSRPGELRGALEAAVQANRPWLLDVAVEGRA